LRPGDSQHVVEDGVTKYLLSTSLTPCQSIDSRSADEDIALCVPGGCEAGDIEVQCCVL
jgi:hypothetical protein